MRRSLEDQSRLGDEPHGRCMICWMKCRMWDINGRMLTLPRAPCLPKYMGYYESTEPRVSKSGSGVGHRSYRAPRVDAVMC